ncbi:MAG: 2-amino-4-hydroxy-6-hydroxymethyldihydropteridine diphosphokinase [Planctomycetales bacterium]|nr:2-amino-4-hydroxy-6-hydroxymethyldihydropteridine diphosphokinase [Planctomycetales bacterium]
MGRCLISLGANLGEPTEAIGQAQQRLSKAFRCTGNAFRLSNLYRTPAIGGPNGQPPFVNAVATVETSLNPWECWQIIRQIETDLGRVRQRRWEARKIDLDILLYDQLRIWTPQLKIPHPRMCMRRFILLPAQEIAGDWVDPVSLLTVKTLADSLRSGAGNVLVCAAAKARAGPLLEESARLAGATWYGETSLALPSNSDDRVGQTDPLRLGRSDSRWVCLREYPDRSITPDTPTAFRPDCKLVVFLTEPIPHDSVAWEDYHRQLAIELRLRESTQGSGGSNKPDIAHIAQKCTGARYLLAGDDRAWVVHEIVAALEAMDCPIERID